jgi:hypothetical protein
MTGLMIALQRNKHEMVNCLIRDPRVDINISHCYGTALEQAIHNKHLDLVELLLLKQPKVNSFQCQSCPLMAAYDEDPVTVIGELRTKHKIDISDDMSCIEMASYVCYDEPNYPNYGEPSCNSKWAEFYSFDGKLLTKVEHNLLDMRKRLDPNAPRPLILKIQKDTINLKYKGMIDTDYIKFIDNNHRVIASALYCGNPVPSPEDLEPYQDKYNLSGIPYYVWDVEAKPVETVFQPSNQKTAKRNEDEDENGEDDEYDTWRIVSRRSCAIM